MTLPLNNAFRIELSKNVRLMNLSTKVSLGYISNLRGSRLFDNTYVSGVQTDGNLVHISNSGVINIELTSIPLTFSHSIYKSSSGKSNLSIFYGIIHRWYNISIDGVRSYRLDFFPEGDEYNINSQPGYLYDNTYGAEFQHLVRQNISFVLKLESQSNNINQNMYYDIIYTSNGDWEDLLGGSSDVNRYIINNFIKRPVLLSFGVSYFIR